MPFGLKYPLAVFVIWLYRSRNHWSYPVAAAAAVTPTEAFPSPAADAVMVEWLPALACAAATVTFCGCIQLAGVKVSVWPLDTVVPVPLSLNRTVTGLLGAVDSLTANDALWPLVRVSEDWLAITVGLVTWKATGFEVVLPRLL